MISRNKTFDFLRVIAALAVVFGHSYELLGASASLRGGDPLSIHTRLNTFAGCGVIMFFAISGYWITQSAERATSWLDFAWRRALRILPGLWVMLVLSVLVLGPLETSLSFANYILAYKTREYLQGFFLYLRDGLPGVFENNPHTSTVNGSLWTLRLEVKCYLLVSLLLIVPRRTRAFVAAFLVILAIYLAARHVFWRPFKVPFFRENSAVTVFALTAFFTGVSVCRFRWEAYCKYHGWAALLTVTLLAGYFVPQHDKLLAWVFTFALSLTTLGVGLHWAHESVDRVMKGDISYGLYLYAFPIQQTILAHHLRVDPLTLFVATLVFLAPLAAFSWVYVEKPMLAERNWFARRRETLVSNEESVHA